MRGARRGAAAGIAGKIAVQVAPVRQIARAAVEPLQVDDRHPDHRAVQFLRLEVVDHAPDDLDAIQFVAVYGRSQAQHRTRSLAVNDHDRRRHREAFDRAATRPGEPANLAGGNLCAQQLQGLGLRTQLRRLVCRRRGWRGTEQGGAPQQRQPTRDLHGHGAPTPEDRQPEGERHDQRSGFTNLSVIRSLSPIEP